MTSHVATTLQVSAEQVLIELSSRLRAVLSSLFSTEPSPRDIEKQLGLHKTLSWRIAQVAFARDPLTASQHVPGEEGIEKFLAAASAAGVHEVLLRAVREAMEHHKSIIKAHAGDRASFDVMLMSLSSPNESAVELKAARRAAYRSASYTWGVQTAVRILAGIITPTSDDAVDFATVRGHVRVRRVRSEGVMRLSRTIEHDTDEPGTRKAAAQPIVPEDVVGGVPLLKAFCTKPLPRTEAVALPGKNVEYRFVDQPIGEQSAISVFTGEVRRDLVGARWRTENNTSNALMLTARDPIGLGVLDLWAPAGFALSHRALVVSAVAVDPLLQSPADWHVLPATASVHRMGKGLMAARLSDVPQYEQVLAQVFSRLGWSADGYELHRIELEYPMLGTCMVLRSELPERV